jgi:uncharacterized membrane-anchored protein
MYEERAVSFKAIILGIIADIVATFVVGFVFGFIYGFVIAARGGEVSQTTLARDQLFQGVSFGIGLFSTFVGGWVVGKIAYREEALNGLLAGIITTAFIGFMFVTFRAHLDQIPRWTIFPAVLLQCPLLVLGSLCAGAFKGDRY